MSDLTSQITTIMPTLTGAALLFKQVASGNGAIASVAAARCRVVLIQSKRFKQRLDLSGM